MCITGHITTTDIGPSSMDMKIKEFTIGMSWLAQFRSEGCCCCMARGTGIWDKHGVAWKVNLRVYFSVVSAAFARSKMSQRSCSPQVKFLFPRNDLYRDFSLVGVAVTSSLTGCLAHDVTAVCESPRRTIYTSLFPNYLQTEIHTTVNLQFLDTVGERYHVYV